MSSISPIMFSTPTPWSWKSPPLPEMLSVPGHELTVPRDRIWHRALWATETTYALCSFLQPGFTDIVCSCQISAQSTAKSRTLTVRLLREALRRLRFQRPTIACRLAWPPHVSGTPPSSRDARLIYEEVGSEGDIEAWTDEVVFDCSGALDDAGNLGQAVETVVRQVGCGFTSPSAALFHVYCIITPSGTTGALVVRGAHALFDASGLTKCMDQLVENIAIVLGGDDYHHNTISWEGSADRLVGSAVDYTIVPWSHEDEKESGMFRRAMDIVKDVQVTCELPIAHPAAEATTTTVFVRSVSDDKLRHILSAVRMHGCTFYPVLFAVATLATLRVKPPGDVEKLSVPVPFTSVNLRGKGLMDRDDDVLSALGFNAFVIRDLRRFIDHPSSSDVWIIANEIRAQILEQEEDLGHISSWADKFISDITTMMERAKATRPQSTQTTVTPRVISLGVMDKYLAVKHRVPGGGVLQVSDPIITVCIPSKSLVLGCMSGVHSFTWNGTMYMCFSFPEAFMGTLDEQEQRSASVLGWSEEFMTILESLGASTE